MIWPWIFALMTHGLFGKTRVLPDPGTLAKKARAIMKPDTLTQGDVMNTPKITPAEKNLAKNAAIAGASGAVGVIVATAVVSVVSSKLLDAAINTATFAKRKTVKIADKK